MSGRTTRSTSDLRRLLRQVPEGSLSSAVESLRAVAFVQFSLRLARALESSLQSPAAIREPTLEYHFHCTHDDLGFGIGVGACELEMNACQADRVRLVLDRTGEGVAERLIPLPQMTPERARSEVLGFVTGALIQRVRPPSAAVAFPPRSRHAGAGERVPDRHGHLTCETGLIIVPGETHLLEEPGDSKRRAPGEALVHSPRPSR